MCNPLCGGGVERASDTVAQGLFVKTGLSLVVGDVLAGLVSETGCLSLHGGEGEFFVVEGGGCVLDGGGRDVEDLVDLVSGFADASTVDRDELEVVCWGWGDVVLMA